MLEDYPQPDRIKTVFFDLGKVLLGFSHEIIVKRLLSRVPPIKRREAELFAFLFGSRNGLCNRYDEGSISSRDFHARINGRFQTGLAYKEFIPLWNDIFDEKVEISRLMRRVRERRPVFLLSNVNELHWEFVRERFPVLSEMDGWVLSYKVGAKKPAPAIYKAAMEAAGAAPGESVFIDDLPENAEAATRCGIRGVVFTGADGLEADLRTMGLIA